MKFKTIEVDPAAITEPLPITQAPSVDPAASNRALTLALSIDPALSN